MGGGCLFLSFLLAFSLLGVGGTQALSEAFAAEVAEEPTSGEAPDAAEKADGADEAALAEPQHERQTIAARAATAEAGEEASDAAEDEGAGPEEGQPDEAEPAVAAAEAADEPAAQAATPSFRVPEERYVYEYVYGVISNDHAVFSDDKIGSYYFSGGELVSQAAGNVLGEGTSVIIMRASAALEGEETVIPFGRDGKYGLWDAVANKVVVEPRYDTEGSGGPGSQWGFIELGAPASDGTYPNAKAVICEGTKTVFTLPLPGCKDDARISYGAVVETYGWSIGWQDASGQHNEFYVEESDGFHKLSGSPRGHDTADGRAVAFESVDGGVAFRVRGTDGSWGDLIALKASGASVMDCSVVSNIIEVRTSGGYQYFKLDGSLLQDVSNTRLQPLGNYVGYERITGGNNPGEPVVRTFVFLDTSGANQAAKELPCLKGKVVDDTFQCLTEGSKLRVYDTNLDLIVELQASLNVNGKAFDWQLKDLGDGIRTLAQESNGTEEETLIFRGSEEVGGDLEGLPGPSAYVAGVCADHIYLMVDPSWAPYDNTLRIYDKELKLVKEIDLSSLELSGCTLEPLSVNSYRAPGYPVFDFRWKDASGQYQSSSLILTKSFDPTDYSRVSEGAGAFLVAEKDGKYGFVDADLKPQGDFVYDNINTYSVEDHFLVTKGGKQQLLDANLKDVLGFSLDSIRSLRATGLMPSAAYLVIDNGTSRVFDREFREIDLMGYRPLEPTGTYGSARVLPNGNTLVYAKNAEGKVGAIDSAGNVLVPFEYEDFAECADADGASDYILLRDAAGWFFVSVKEVQGATTNPECDAKGHDYQTVTHEPTCEEDGYVQKVCRRCGHGYREEGTTAPKLGHDYVLTTAAVEPTCTEDGKGATYTCTRCAKVKEDEAKKALGHAGFDWEVVTAPTCNTDGLRARSCDRCDAAEQEAIPALGHAWRAPTWEWTDDFSAATALSSCQRGCGETLEVEAEMTHRAVEGGFRHEARATIGGQTYQDGRLVLQWTDANGVARTLVVRGAPVVDGFSVDPTGLLVDADADVSIVIDVSSVTGGGVFDALVAKMGSGWPGGTFDVRLAVNGAEQHDNFGTLALSFPTNGGSEGKRATIYHCHKNDVGNITAHDLTVSDDGIAFLAGITDLSTFALEIHEEGAASGAASSASSLASTGDEVPAGMTTSAAVALVALAGVCLAALMLRRRRARG